MTPASCIILLLVQETALDSVGPWSSATIPGSVLRKNLSGYVIWAYIARATPMSSIFTLMRETEPEDWRPLVCKFMDVVPHRAAPISNVDPFDRFLDTIPPEKPAATTKRFCRWHISEFVKALRFGG
jgi:hypothetical protein